ncbi:hypothetical protein K8R62_00725 [bacterium]|nr:hypothetical protein [bacterium]
MFKESELEGISENNYLEFREEINNLESDDLGIKDYLLSMSVVELNNVDLLLNEVNETVQGLVLVDEYKFPRLQELLEKAKNQKLEKKEKGEVVKILQ